MEGTLAACRRVEAGCWRSKTDKAGAPVFLHRLDGAAAATTPPPPPGPAADPPADADLLHRAYSALLGSLPLGKAHQEALRARGLSEEEIDRRGYRSLPVQGRARLARELRERFGDSLLSVPGFVAKEGKGGRYATIAGAAGLLVPIRDMAGRVVALLSRRDDAGDGRGKYLYLSSARHGGPGPGAPPHCPLGFPDTAATARLTEGGLKADSTFALSGLPTVGAAGLAWRPALDALKAKGCRTVRLAFDADARGNPNVARALLTCALAAAAEGLAVELERWPAEHKGIDDALAAGAAVEVLAGEAALAAVREIVAAAGVKAADSTAASLERLPGVLATGGPAALFRDRALLETLAELQLHDAAGWAAARSDLAGAGVRLRDLDKALAPLARDLRARRPAPPPAVLGEAGYRVAGGRLCRERFTPDRGTALIPLCNFTGRIVEVVTRDDGAEQHTLFAVEGARADGRPLPPAVVPADAFGRLEWVAGAWHGEAVVYAGQGTRDHLRCAIELLSTDRRRRVEYLHTGWRETGGAWHYLHGGGSIGPEGEATDIAVSLPDTLAGFALPAPPAGRELAEAVRASLRLLDGLAPDALAFPLWAATWRAVLGDTDFALHLAGPTAAGKSELAALCQQHFGAGLDARHLPGNWASTGNALEAATFAAKDALFVVDDFAPAGAPGDRQRLAREADRLFRAQGNRAGRLRLRADATARPAKPPRGLILSTGEDVPPGQSLRARMLVVEVGPGELNWGRLTACQGDAAAGKYAAALAGFVHWLAPRFGEVRSQLPGERAELRGHAAAAGQHARLPGIVADLALGLRWFLAFARQAGAVTEAAAGVLWERGWQALQQAAAAQAAHQAAAEPCGQFLRLLAAALASGRAHCAGPDGREPESAPEAWGWRRAEGTEGLGWRPQGRRIGWVDGADLYLEPEAAYAEANELARLQGEALPVSGRTLGRRLRERGLLASWDAPRQRNTVRRSLGGVREREVFHLPAATLACAPPSEPSDCPGPGAESLSTDGIGADTPSDGSPDEADGWPLNRTVAALQPSSGAGQRNGQKPTAPAAEDGSIGRFGRSESGGGATPAPEFSTSKGGPVPPAGARLHFADGKGRPCGPGEAHQWTWEGAPEWYNAGEWPHP